MGARVRGRCWITERLATGKARIACSIIGGYESCTHAGAFSLRLCERRRVQTLRAAEIYRNGPSLRSYHHCWIKRCISEIRTRGPVQRSRKRVWSCKTSTRKHKPQRLPISVVGIPNSEDVVAVLR